MKQKACRILLVEDDTVLAQKIKLQLEGFGYSVPMIVSTGEDALAKAISLSPDLILMDIMLPGKLDGIETAQRINNSSPIPIIYLTAHADDELLQRARITEPFGYIIKPATPHELHATMSMALYRAENEKRLRQAAWATNAFASIVDGVVATNVNGHIVLMNHAAETILKLDESKVRGKHWQEVIRTRGKIDEVVIQKMVAKAIEKQEVSHRDDDGELVRHTGSTIPINLQVSPVMNNDVLSGVTLVIRNISKRKRVEAALQKSEEKYRQLVELAQEGIWVIDKEGLTTFVNPGMARMLGYSIKQMLGKHLLSFMDEDGIKLAKYNLKRREEGITEQHEFKFLRKDGKLIYTTMATAPIIDESGEYQGAIAGVMDITERSLAQKKLEHTAQALKGQTAILQSIFNSMSDGVITTDIDGRVDYMNPVVEGLSGWAMEEAQNQKLTHVINLIDEGTRDQLPDPTQDCMRQNVSVSLNKSTLLSSRDNKRQYSIEVTASPLRSHDDAIVGCVLVLHDVTELRGMARQMSYQVSHDALTGLVNRREFEVRLEQALNSARKDGHIHAMCYLDLDQFKVVNDTSGHVAGDELLKQLAAQLLTIVREVDTLARLGGDEFGVLLEHCPLERAREIADELRNVISSFRFAWQDKVFDVGVSVGLVPINATSGGLTDVMSAADSACYMAKDHGRNRVHVFQSDDLEMADRHGEMQWVSKISRGLESNSFVLYAQSIMSLDKQHNAGCHYEVLVRLLNGNNVVVQPYKFIPAAERYNLMPSLDRWVISTAFSSLAEMLGHCPGYELERDTCAINLSGTTLSDDHFLEFVQEQLSQYQVPPGVICFEITETAAIANLAKASHLIHELRRVGCRFALDDFGTGLSSFAYLKSLQVDFIKIDGGFVADMRDDPLDHAIVSSINQIGHVMGIKTIAESVEDKATLAQLESMGVDFAQGYCIEKPKSLGQLLEQLMGQSRQARREKG